VQGFKIGDKVQYNKKYNPKEVVLILSISEGFALIQFPSGSKIATRLSQLWPLKEPTAEHVKVQEHQKKNLP
jgi:hypothetical protein